MEYECDKCGATDGVWYSYIGNEFLCDVCYREYEQGEENE